MHHVFLISCTVTVSLSPVSLQKLDFTKQNRISRKEATKASNLPPFTMKTAVLESHVFKTGMLELIDSFVQNLSIITIMLMEDCAEFKD